MSIAEKDIKKLWGLAAGICSFPGCGADCIEFVDMGDPVLIGEMAHVIARHPSGARGRQEGGSDDYSNLILLCPTHHTVIDKAEEDVYTEEMLLEWKANHEAWVRNRLAAPHYDNKPELCWHILQLLTENKATWRTYGPESSAATSNPLSNVARLWTLRKLSEVIPKNTRIVNMLMAHAHLFRHDEYVECTNFIEHAAGFEVSTYDRLDNVPRFPQQFEEIIRNELLE